MGIPLLVAAFSVTSPAALQPANLPPGFDGARALGLARDLARTYPSRRPGSLGSVGAAGWISTEFERAGFRPQRDAFRTTVPQLGRVRLVNVAATASGRTPDMIVVMAHRDDTGIGPGAEDNASGTAALVELARAYTAAPGSSAGTARPRFAAPAHTLVFLSTDGGAYGGAGARHFLAEHAGRIGEIVGVVNLDTIARRAPIGVQLAGNTPRSAPAALVKTASARIRAQTGRAARVPTLPAQLIDLGFPFNLYEHAPFVSRGIPAVTVTTAGDRPPDPAEDVIRRLDRRTFQETGRSAQALLSSLDRAVEVTPGTSSYLYLGSRIVPGWAVELVLLATLLPFLVSTVDLFARCRRRRIPLAPALRSYRSRMAFWLWVGALFALFALAGVWEATEGGVPPPGLAGAGDWPVLGVAGLAALAALGWLVARERILPRRPVLAEEELAGATAALLALGVVSLVVAAVNPFALVFVVFSLHAWLWLPQVRNERAWVRAAVFVAGLIGPALLVGSFATRLGLGLDAPWYLAQLAADGRISIALLVAFLAWLAAGGQLAAVAAGRYAPYAGAGERAPRGPIRQAVRAVVFAVTRRRRSAEMRRRAVG